MLLLLVLMPGCRRHRHARPRATKPVASALSDASAEVAPPSSLSDLCKRHDDCVKVDLYVEGPLRCCLACGAQAAASKLAADAFLAACTQETEMRECPIYDCKAVPMDAVCVGGHCMLRPRP